MMASLLTTTVQHYDRLMQQADPRVASYPLMPSPWPTVCITLTYIYVVQVGLPRFMAHRQPYNLRKLLVFYNLAMVLFSAYIFIEFGLAGWFSGYTLGCQPVDYSRSAKAIRMVNVCWWFYISKIIELCDTFFFLLRKKFNQVSFLHVIHHSVMPLSWYIGVKFVPGGFGTFHGLLNAFIHFVMYSYYGLSALGPRYQKYLWWKKYMTTLQIVQFIMVTLHCSQLFFMRDCSYPAGVGYWIGSYALFFLVMFANFYRQAYRKSAAVKTAAVKTAAVKTAAVKSAAVKSTNGSLANGVVSNGTMTNGLKKSN